MTAVSSRDSTARSIATPGKRGARLIEHAATDATRRLRVDVDADRKKKDRENRWYPGVVGLFPHLDLSTGSQPTRIGADSLWTFYAISR